MRDKNTHAQELRNLLSHLLVISNDERAKKRIDLERQFGEFCRSLVSFTERYLTVDDRAEIETFMAKVQELHTQLFPKEEFEDNPKGFFDFNKNLSRQILVNFPGISFFKTSENFNLFLSAFSKTPLDSKQEMAFEKLRVKARAHISPPREAIAPAGGGTALASISAPAPLAGSLASPSPVRGLALNFDHIVVDAPASIQDFDTELKEVLGNSLLSDGSSSFLADLRIENFRDFAHFSGFLTVALGETQKTELLAGWETSGTNVELLFVQLAMERAAYQALTERVAQVDALLPAFVNCAQTASAAAVPIRLEAPKHFLENSFVPSRCASEGRGAVDYARMTNLVFLIGHKLRKELIAYEKLKNERDANDYDEIDYEDLSRRIQSHVDRFYELIPVYLNLVEHSMAIAKELGLPPKQSESIEEQVTKLHTWIYAAEREAADFEDHFYYYAIAEILDDLERYEFPDSISLAGVFELVQKFEAAKQAVSIKKLSFDELNFDSRSAPARAFEAAPDALSPTTEGSLVSVLGGPIPEALVSRNQLLTTADLNADDPLSLLPPSRASDRMPISFASEELADFLSAAPKDLEAYSAQTAILSLQGRQSSALKRMLGFDPRTQLVTVAFAGSLDERGRPRLPFLPLQVNGVVKREVELNDYFSEMLRIADATAADQATLAAQAPDGVSITRGFMTDLAFHIAPPKSSSVTEVQLRGIVLNYFRLFESYRLLYGNTPYCGEEPHDKLLLLPIFPVLEKQAAHEVKNYELGAYLALIALMMFREYRRFDFLSITLVADASVVPGIRKQMEFWFHREWGNRLANEILSELRQVSARDASPVADIVEGLMAEWGSWFSEGEFSEREARRLEIAVSASPFEGELTWQQYGAYMEVIEDRSVVARVKKLESLWELHGAAESLHVKMQRFFTSYLSSLSPWKHNRRSVTEFINEMDADIKAGRPWETQEQVETKLRELLYSVQRDFCESSGYGAEEMVRGSLFSRIFLAMEKASKFFLKAPAKGAAVAVGETADLDSWAAGYESYGVVGRGAATNERGRDTEEAAIAARFQQRLSLPSGDLSASGKGSSSRRAVGLNFFGGRGAGAGADRRGPGAAFPLGFFDGPGASAAANAATARHPLLAPSPSAHAPSPSAHAPPPLPRDNAAGTGLSGAVGRPRRSSLVEGAHEMFGGEDTIHGEGEADSPSRALLTAVASSVLAGQLSTPRPAAAGDAVEAGASHHGAHRLGSRA